MVNLSNGGMRAQQGDQRKGVVIAFLHTPDHVLAVVVENLGIKGETPIIMIFRQSFMDSLMIWRAAVYYETSSCDI